MFNVKLSNQTREIGKPADWDETLDGPCITISVCDFTDIQSGANFMKTLWRPSPEELAVLNNGGVISLEICGDRHPVIGLGVQAV